MKDFLAKTNYYEENLKFVKLQQQCNIMNAVDSLLGCSFTHKTFEEKKAIVAAGRPKPKSEQLIEMNKHANRRFSVAKYEKYDWLTVSESKN